MGRTLPMLAIALVLSCAANDAAPPADGAATTKALAAAVFGHWVHSREEDAEEVHVYRAAGYDFPAARFREAFEIRRDGTFVLHVPGRADAPESIAGRWVQTGPMSIAVSFPAERAEPMTIVVVAAEPGILRIRPAATL